MAFSKLDKSSCYKCREVLGMDRLAVLEQVVKNQNKAINELIDYFVEVQNANKEVIEELKSEIEALKAEIEALKAEVADKETE